MSTCAVPVPDFTRSLTLPSVAELKNEMARPAESVCLIWIISVLPPTSKTAPASESSALRISTYTFSEPSTSDELTFVLMLVRYRPSANL